MGTEDQREHGKGDTEAAVLSGMTLKECFAMLLLRGGDCDCMTAFRLGWHMLSHIEMS